MKIAYNPSGKTRNTKNYDKSDIVFDGNAIEIITQGVIYKGTDTTYDPATTTQSGLMSASDKQILDTLASVTQINVTKQVGVDWSSAGISGTELASGTYLMQLYINSNAACGITDSYYTGTFTWYSGTPSETSSDEIPLHVIGAKQTNSIYLRTYCAANNKVFLQIAASTAFTGSVQLQFKFKKII